MEESEPQSLDRLFVISPALAAEIFRLAARLRLSRLTRRNAVAYSEPFRKIAGILPETHALKSAHPMANPKRKQSKRRSANRRAANAFKAPQFAKDPTDGSAFRPHRVNPKNGMYRGRQVLNVEV